jgi:hypothetical protein
MSAHNICTSNRILLHIGYHKTATTWFQSELFSRSELEFKSLSVRNLVHRALCGSNPFACGGDNDVQQIVSEAQEATRGGQYFVVSHERLSGYPASGGFDSRMIAGRLKLHFPNARIFCMFREQKAMILSAWRQQVVDGGGLSLNHFINQPEPDIRRVPLFDPIMYRYTHLFEHYRELFGADNVLFRPYEAFCAQPAQILAGIADLLEHKTLGRRAEELATDMKRFNRSPSLSLLSLQRVLNVLFARTQLSQNCLIDVGARPLRAAIRSMDRGIGSNVLRPIDSYIQRKAKRRISERFGTFFDEDNALLSTLVEMRLSEFGYSVRDRTA